MSKIQPRALRSRVRASTGWGAGVGADRVSVAAASTTGGADRGPQTNGLRQGIVELWQIAGHAGGDQIAVHHQRLVDVVGPRVDQIGTDLVDTGERASLQHLGRDEQLRPMADSADWL